MLRVLIFAVIATALYIDNSIIVTVNVVKRLR
jgi:hypothetical protein